MLKNPTINMVKCSIEHLEEITNSQEDLFYSNFRFNREKFDDFYFSLCSFPFKDIVDNKEVTYDAYVLTIDNKLAGYYLSDTSYREDNKHVTTLMQIYVIEEFRGKGYSKLLLNHFELNSKSKGNGILTLDVSLVNEAAFNLYNNNGYENVKSYVELDEIRNTMEKII